MHADVQALVRKFAAPLADYASTSAERKELAEMLVRNLWTAMVCGPEMEEETWKAIKKHAQMDDDSLQPLKDLYFTRRLVVFGPRMNAAAADISVLAD